MHERSTDYAHLGLGAHQRCTLVPRALIDCTKSDLGAQLGAQLGA